MSEETIEVRRRESGGKNVNRRLRAAGQIPAVVYGGDQGPIPIQVDRRRLLELLRSGQGENAVFLLKLAGSAAKRHTMITDMQIDPTTREVLHLDFKRVKMDEKVRVTVSIELEGTPLGVKNEGGIIDFVNRGIDVECLPGKIPSFLALDVSQLHIGEHLEAKDIPYPDGVELVDDPDKVILSVAMPRIVEEEEVEEEEELLEAETEEPEVIGRGKEEEEGDEG